MSGKAFSGTLIITKGETLDNLIAQCPTLKVFPDVLRSRQTAPLMHGVWEYSLIKTENSFLAQPEHLLAYLANNPQVLWQVDTEKRVIQGNGVTLHVSLYPVERRMCEAYIYDQRPDDGHCYISAQELYSAQDYSYRLYVRRIAGESDEETGKLLIPAFVGSVGQLIHKLMSDCVIRIPAFTMRIEQKEEQVKVGLLHYDDVHDHTPCISEEEVRRQMGVNLQTPASLQHLLAFVARDRSLLKKGPIVALNGRFECRRYISPHPLAPEQIVVERYLPSIQDNCDNRYLYIK